MHMLLFEHYKPKVDKKSPYYNGNNAEYACRRILHTPNSIRDLLDEGSEDQLYYGSEKKQPAEPVENQGGGLANVPRSGDQSQAEHGGEYTDDAQCALVIDYPPDQPQGSSWCKDQRSTADNNHDPKNNAH
jgi:hypothetical protein